MAKLIVGSRPFDMTAWDLSDIATGTVAASSATDVDVTGSGGRFVYQITGTGFTTFDTNGFPTDGTVTGLVEDVPGKTPLTISGISISATDFMGFVNSNDATGRETAIFSGNDSFLGKAGNDVLLGFAGNDIFNLTKGGNDTASGGDGNDTFNFGAAFTAADSVDGGPGSDKVTLAGDYSAGVAFGATTMVNVETLVVGAGHNYNLTLADATVASGQTLTINAVNLSGLNSIALDASADTDGNFRFTGGAGNDSIALSHWNAHDIVNGGGGSDILILNGDFSGGVTLSHTQVVSVETLKLAAGHSYNITPDSQITTATIDGSALSASDSLVFNGSSNTTVYTIIGGAGNDVLQGGAASNVFDLSQGGDDMATGSNASDTFDVGAALTAADTINGSGGNDTVNLSGTYSSPLVLGASTLTSVETLTYTGTSIDLTMNDGNVAAGQTLKISIDANSFTFDGSAETNGNYNITSNAGTNDITGGAGNDTVEVDGASSKLGRRRRSKQRHARAFAFAERNRFCGRPPRRRKRSEHL